MQSVSQLSQVGRFVLRRNDKNDRPGDDGTPRRVIHFRNNFGVFSELSLLKM